MNKIYLAAIALTFSLAACQPATDKKDAPKASETKTDSKSDTKVDAEIVYVNSDSLIKNYEFWKKAKKEITARGLSISNDLEIREIGLKNEETALIQRQNSMTMGDFEASKQAFMAKGQNYMQYKETMAKQLNEEERVFGEKMSKNLDDFMKRYAATNGYKMILGYQQGVTMWYADPKLDITAMVIKAINEEYNTQSTAPVVAPATTPAVK